ncbi:hypothetical protein ACOAOT_14810 [Lacrimispora sp. AGF001]|uniref:hypothetical protein n=1 Tax=Lacrimispora sp. AGF001 TaxID=3401631 RepID=UPI003B430C80
MQSDKYEKTVISIIINDRKNTKERSGGTISPLFSYEDMEYLKFKNLLTGKIRRMML